MAVALAVAVSSNDVFALFVRSNSLLNWMPPVVLRHGSAWNRAQLGTKLQTIGQATWLSPVHMP